MKINNIELTNFLSFYDYNKIEFNDGATIIIGQNRTGKSKLFDAFNWVLYDKAFKTEVEKWEKTKDWKDAIANNKAKILSKPNDTVITQVVLEIKADDDKTIIIDRSYTIKKLQDEKWECPNFTELNLCKIDPITGNSKTLYNEDAQEEIINLFPEYLSKYFLFQGENIGQIMSLSDKSAFKHALNDISQIKVFEIVCFNANKVYKKINDEFLNKETADIKQDKNKKELSELVEKLRDDEKSKKNELDTLTDEQSIARQAFDEIESRLDQFLEISEILNKIKSSKEQIKILTFQRDKELINGAKLLFNSWMFAKTELLIGDFLNTHKQGIKDKKFPERILQEFLKEMLIDEICKVCLTKAPKNSEQYKNIIKLLDPNALNKDIAIITTLASNANTYLAEIKEIPQSIKNFEESISVIDDKIKTQKNIKDSEELNLKNILPKDLENIDIESLGELKNSRRKLQSELDTNNNKITKAKIEIGRLGELIKEKEEELAKLVQKIGTEKEKKMEKLANKVKAISEQFYDIFYKKLITDIENEANQYYHNMTELNKAISGKIKLDEENKEIYTIDEDGARIFNINQANKVSLQISFVAAILAVSYKFWNRYFPFIADAPISALGGDNKIPAIDTITKIFNQSIILLKDDVPSYEPEAIKNDNVRKLIKSNESISIAYEFLMSDAKVEKEQHTIIKKIR